MKTLNKNDFAVIVATVEKKLTSLKGEPITQNELVSRLQAKNYCTDKSFDAAGVFVRTEVIPAIEVKWYEDTGKPSFFLCTGTKGFYIAKNADDAAGSLDMQRSRIIEQHKRWEAKTAYFNRLYPDGRSQQEIDFEVPNG